MKTVFIFKTIPGEYHDEKTIFIPEEEAVNEFIFVNFRKYKYNFYPQYNKGRAMVVVYDCLSQTERKNIKENFNDKMYDLQITDIYTK